MAPVVPNIGTIATIHSGIVSTPETTSRRVMSASSGLVVSPATGTRGSSAMPHFGQAPGWSCTTSGSIGQTYSGFTSAGTAIGAGTDARGAGGCAR